MKGTILVSGSRARLQRTLLNALNLVYVKYINLPLKHINLIGERIGAF